MHLDPYFKQGSDSCWELMQLRKMESSRTKSCKFSEDNTVVLFKLIKFLPHAKSSQDSCHLCEQL